MSHVLLLGRLKPAPEIGHSLEGHLQAQSTATAREPSQMTVSTKSFAHPYYWAPFILMGNWL
jgi:hypothetical protein